MPDSSLITTVISTAGALCGALGVVALTGRLSNHREDRKDQRQRDDAEMAARQQAYADLLGAAAQMRVHIETTCERHWRDMNIRLGAIQDHAVAVGLQASRAALLSPGAVADAALALGKAASRLSAWTAKNTELGGYSGQNNEFLAGEVQNRPDLTELDERVAEFFQLASTSFS